MPIKGETSSKQSYSIKVWDRNQHQRLRLEMVCRDVKFILLLQLDWGWEQKARDELAETAQVVMCIWVLNSACGYLYISSPYCKQIKNNLVINPGVVSIWK